MSLNSSVNKATGYCIDDLCSINGRGTAELFTRVIRLEREPKHSHLSAAEVKNA
jgi:hypothetical protein